MNNSLNVTRTISTNPLSQLVIAVANNDDIYTAFESPFSAYKWTLNSTTIASFDSTTCGLFIDINNTLYISLRDKHKIVSRSLQSSSNVLTTVVGTGCSGNTANTLNGPLGIFVDTNFDLYVADGYNNRIQLFRSGQQNAITLVGNGSLNRPISIRIYLFLIV